MSGTGQPGGLLSFLPFAIILVIFYVLILMPMQRRQKKVQEFQESLKVGDKVVTTGGVALEHPTTNVYELVDGKLRRVDVYHDREQALAAVGLVE